MVKASTVNLIFLFAGIFMLLMMTFAALSAKDQTDKTNQSDEQDVKPQQDEQIAGAQKPFIIGLGGFYWLVLFVLILAGIGVFIKIMFGRKV
jgi:hypothetical protein